MSTPAVLAALSLTHSAKAQLYWDINGTTAGGSSTTTAAGTWDTVTSNWNTVADGTGTTGLWTGSSAPVTAVFSAGTNVNSTAVYGVTVSGTITGVDGITFEEGNVSLNTGTVTLSAPTITATAATSTIAGVLAGNVGLTKVGTGLVVLTNAANSYTGNTLINTGAIRFNVPGALAGDPGATLTLGGTSAVAGFGYTTFSQTDLNRVSSGSIGTVALAFGTTTGQIDSNNLDFSAAGANLANVYLGALTGNNATISGVITPFSNVYRFGSGGGTLQVATTLTAGNSISIGNGVTSGTVSFSGTVTNQTTADLTINTSGMLAISADSDLGDNVTDPSQAVQFNGGILGITGSSPVISHNMTFSSGAGTITTATNPTLSGIFSGTQAFTKAGAGKLILSGNISGYTGAATITAGTLEVNATLPATSVAVTGSLGGIGSISNGGSSIVTVNAAGQLVPGLDTTLTGNPTFTVDNLTLAAANSNIDERIGSTSNLNDKVVVTGALTATAGGVFNVTTSGSVSTGNSYTLLTYTGTPLTSANFALFGLSSAPAAGLHYILVNDTANSSIDLSVQTGTPTWIHNGSGNWIVDANWSPSQANGIGDTASFAGAISSAATVTLTANRTVGTLTFDNSNRYTIAGTSTLTMDVPSGSAAINVLSGAQTITTPVTLNDATTLTVSTGSVITFGGVVAGPGALTFAGPGNAVLTAKPGAALTVSGGSLFATTANMPAAVTLNGTGFITFGTGTSGAINTTYTGVISGTSATTGASSGGGPGNAGGVFSTTTLTGANTFKGTFYSAEQIFQLAGANGALNGASTIDMFKGSLLINDSTNNNANRVGDATTVNLRGAQLSFTGNAAGSTETIGNLTLSPDGLDYLTVTPTTASDTLTIGSITRNPGGALFVRANGLGTTTVPFGRVIISSPPAISGLGTPSATPLTGIIADTTSAATGITATLATYDTSVGIRQLTGSEYSATAVPNTNYAPVAAESPASGITLNSIEFGGAGSVASVGGVGVTFAGISTISSGMILSTSTSTSTVTGGTVAFGTSAGAGEAIIAVYGGGLTSPTSLTIASAISSTGLTKVGNGTLSLTGSNNLHSGILAIDQGILIVNSTARINGASSVDIGNDGYIDSNQGYRGAALKLTSATGNYTMPLVMNGNFFQGTPTFSTTPGTLESNGGNNTWSGNITFNDNEVNTGNNLYNILSAASGSTLVLSGTISNGIRPDGSTEQAGLMTYGLGDIVFAGTSPNNFTNFIRPLGGRLILEKDAAFGPVPFQNGEGVLFGTSTATHTTIAFQAPASSPGFNYATQQVIQFGGVGVNNDGVVLSNLGGANTFNGVINMDTEYLQAGYNNPFKIDIATSSSLEISGNIVARFTSPRDIIKQGNGQLVISGNNNVIPTVSGSPIGTLVATGSVVDILAGGITVTGPNGQMPGGYTSYVVRAGANLTLDNSRGVNTSRVASSAAISLSGLGAELKLIGNATTPVTQSVGNINIASYSTLTSQAQTGGASTEIDLPGFDSTTSRTNRGTVLLRGMDNSTSFIKFVSAPALLGGGGSGSLTSILPSAVGDTSPSGIGTDFVTVQGNFARVLTSGEYTQLVSGNSTPDNTTAIPFDNGGANHLTANLTEVNSIKMSGGTTISIDSGKRLYVFSGAILGVGAAPSNIAGGNVAFEQYYPAGTQDPSDPIHNFTVGAYATDPAMASPGNPALGITDGAVGGTAQEGVITVPTGSILTQSSSDVISGAAGLTKSGGGTLQLFGINTFGGTKHFWTIDDTDGDTTEHSPTSGAPLTINAGRLEFNTDSNLGDAGSPVVLNGGTLAPLAVSTSTRAISLLNPSTNIIDVGASGDFTTSGQVTGTGLTKNGTGVLGLSNTNNNYSGGTLINAGRLRILASASVAHPELGTGTVTLAGGSIEADDTFIFDRTVVTTSTNTTGGFYILPTKTLTFGSGSASTNAITGSGNIAVDGGGTLILANINGTQFDHSGRYFINNGSTLQYSPNDAAKTTAGIGNPPGGVLWTLTNGSTLRFNLSSTGFSDFGNTSEGVAVGTGGGNIDIVGTNSVYTQSALSGTGTLTKVGTGEYSLGASAAAGNTGFSGKFIITNGTFSVQDRNLSTNADNLLGTGSDSGLTPFMQVYGNTEFLYRGGGKSLTMASNQSIMLTSNGPVVPALGVITNVFTINGVIKSDPVNPASGLQLDALSGSLVLAGSNTYSGDTFIKTLATAGGTSLVRTGKANTLPSGTTVHFDAQSATGTATLDLSPAGTTTAFDQTVAGIINDGTLGTVTIRNSSATAVANLTINNPADDTFSGNLTGTTLNINHVGAGTLVLTGTADAFGGLDGTGNTTIGNGSGITVTANHFRQNTLTINNNSIAKANAVASLTDATQSANAISRVSTLTINPGAQLDLNNTKLIVAGGSQTGTWNTGISHYDGITGLVQTGRNNGTWDGAGGIITSQSNAKAAQNYLTTLAVASAADVKGITGAQTALFAGQTVTAADTLVMYTYNGDANLDGKVDADDYFQIDSNYNKSGTSFGFNKGDFNYDGVINGDDYFLIDSAYSAIQSGSLPIIAHGPPALDGGASISGGVAAVPEPASLSVLVLGAGLLGRRRRKI